MTCLPSSLSAATPLETSAISMFKPSRAHKHGDPGTGKELQGLAAEIQGLRLVTGTGEHIEMARRKILNG